MLKKALVSLVHDFSETMFPFGLPHDLKCFSLDDSHIKFSNSLLKILFSTRGSHDFKIYVEISAQRFICNVQHTATSKENMSMKCILFEPHFYIAKLGYAGYSYFFLFLLQNIDCWYSLEPPRLCFELK